VVVLNWNNADDTIACVEGLSAASPPPGFVVVVDNGSEDNSLARIRDWITLFETRSDSARMRVHLIAADRNLGFAGGTNRGLRWLMKDTDASHLMLLNNDATVAKSFFADAAEALEQIGRDAIVGPTIFEDPDRDKVWYAGGAVIPLRALLEHNRVRPASSTPVPTDFVCGCAMIVSRDVVTRIGELSERFFPAYFEDGDYCSRAVKAGVPLMYAPKPTVYHKVGATVNAAKMEDALAFHKNRLRVIYVRRNFDGFRKFAALGYLAMTKPGRFALEVLRGRPGYGWAVISGTASGLTSRNVRD
jgi:GT2 family glycosyltransferase